MRTFVLGDIHGAHKALLECFKSSGFDYRRDRLICLGDVCDRGTRVKECIDELLKIKHCIYILGNHDAWALEWAIHGKPVQDWGEEGGYETMVSYQGIGMPKAHIQFLSEAPLWFVDKNRLFVHGGFDSERSVEQTPSQTLLWDRTLISKAREANRLTPDYTIGGYDEIFVGHTPTLVYGENKPQKYCNLWMLDTGAGFPDGKLTIMDIDTKQFWQSERIK